jgi:hypothetical protein
MATFTLDTSGEVELRVHSAVRPELRQFVAWSNLAPFEQGYVEGLFATTEDEGSTSLRDVRAFSDLAPETLARIMEDCASASTNPWFSYTPDANGGRQFWVERRNRALRGEGHRFPPLTLHLADDGLIYFRESR